MAGRATGIPRNTVSRRKQRSPEIRRLKSVIFVPPHPPKSRAVQKENRWSRQRRKPVLEDFHGFTQIIHCWYPHSPSPSTPDEEADDVAHHNTSDIEADAIPPAPSMNGSTSISRDNALFGHSPISFFSLLKLYSE